MLQANKLLRQKKSTEQRFFVVQRSNCWWMMPDWPLCIHRAGCSSATVLLTALQSAGSPWRVRCKFSLLEPFSTWSQVKLTTRSPVNDSCDWFIYPLRIGLSSSHSFHLRASEEPLDGSSVQSLGPSSSKIFRCLTPIETKGNKVPKHPWGSGPSSWGWI